MKFGITLPNYGKTALARDMPRVAAAAEAAGYDSVWVSDHLIAPQRYGPVYARTLEPLLALGYLAGQTSRVRLGTSVIILPQRDPILLAKQAAAIDQLSSGRLILGVGVGWMQEQYEFLRVDFRQRGRLADEWLRVMRVLWSEDPCEFRGEFVQFADAYFEPKPVQPGGPPVHVGGASPAALRRAAVLGNGWHASALNLADFAAGVTLLRQWSEGKPRWASLRSYSAIGPHAESFRADPDFLMAGAPGLFAARIAEYAEAGLDEFICGFAYRTVGDILAQLELFAAQVMPQFRRE